MTCWPAMVAEWRWTYDLAAMRHMREVLRLKFVGGVPIREIARRIGVAASTVRTTIKRFQAAGLSWPLPEESIHRTTSTGQGAK